MRDTRAAASELTDLRAQIEALRARFGALAPERRQGAEAADGADPDPAAIGEDLARLSAELALSEARHRAILESAVDYAIIATDLRGRVTTWNEGARRILGWSEEEMLGHPGERIFTPEDRASGAPERERARALAEGRAADERWHLRRDGSRFWATGLLMPLRVGGDVQGFLKIMRDRSGEREAEERQRRADERLQLALGASDVIGIWEWDFESDRVVADANFGRIYGIDPARAEAGAPLQAFLDRHHPEDMPALRDGLARARAGHGRFSQEYRVVRPDGSIRWVLAHGDIVFANGRPVRFPGAVVDITGSKRTGLFQAALLALGDRFRDLEDPAEMSFVAAEIIGRALGVTRAGYGLVGEDGLWVEIERDWTVPGVLSIAGRHLFSDYGAFVEDLRRGEAVLIEDVEADPRISAEPRRLRALNIKALLNAPVMEQGRLVAILFLTDAKLRHWSPEELAFVRDVSQRTRDAVERRRAEDHQRLLMHELQHRVKNTLAMVQAIATQTFGGPANEAARDAFANRVVALGRASDILTRAGWAAASVSDLVREAVSPYRSRPDRVAISGPPIEIAAQAALSFTLALHELCTNASKYGALSTEGGRVLLEWSVERGDTFALRWREQGGPPVRPPGRKGFGTKLLERTLGGQFGGEVETDYDPAGLTFTCRLPLPRIQSAAAGDPAPERKGSPLGLGAARDRSAPP